MSALIIGLGGTGKQVLLNLRRLYYERYGTTRPPYVGHLWIDTDPRNTNLDGQEMDVLMREVDFQADEKVSIEVLQADLGNIYNHPHDHPHIFSWFDKRVQELGEIVNGAGGIRSLGRLAFFFHYHNIMRNIRNLHQKITSAQVHNQLQTQNRTDALEIWLIFSIAGGTGSGIFLDFAFALGDKWPNAFRRSIILLPSVFANDTKKRFYGNAYAALMELEHYTHDRGTQARFPLAWTREMYEQGRTMAGPVFHDTYLIDNAPASNVGSLALENKNTLCRMIAERLYIEYSPGPEVNSLAPVINRERANFIRILNTSYTHTYTHNGLSFDEVFSRHYSSFGLSKLYVPADRSETTAQHRLVKELIEFWTVDNKLTEESLNELLVRDCLSSAGVNNSTTTRDFLVALESGTGERLTRRLDQLISDKQGEFLSLANSSQVGQKIRHFLQEDLLQTQLAHSHANPDQWGSLCKSVVQHRDRHYQTVIHKLHQLLARLLSEPAYRFAVARDVLHRICERLTQDAEQFKNLADKHRAAGQEADQQIRQLFNWLEEATDYFTRKTLIEVLMEKIGQRVIRELQSHLAGEAVTLAKQVIDAIGQGITQKDTKGQETMVETGLLKQLHDYHEVLKNNIGGRLKEQLRALEKIELSPIYQELGEGVKETDRFYVDDRGKPIGADTLARWEKRFFDTQTAEGPTDLWGLRHVLEQGESHLIERLLNFAQETMCYLQDQHGDAITRLNDYHKSDSQEYQTKIKKLLSYAESWLPDPTHFVPYDALNPRQYIRLVARHPNHHSGLYANFKKAVAQQTLGYQFVDTTPDRVYAFSEVAGFPLMAIRNLNRYRNDSYFPRLENSKILHTDLAFEKFPDLLIKESEEAKSYVETMEIFLKATLLGIIEAEKSGNDDHSALLKYNYLDNSQIYPDQKELGAFSVAIARLARPGEVALRKQIQASVVHAINDMDENTLRKWCALLSFHADGGGDGTSYYSRFPKDHLVHAILRREALRLIEQNGDSMKQAAITYGNNLKTWASTRPSNQTTWAVESPGESGIYILNSWKR